MLHGRICDSGLGGMTCSLLGFGIAPSSFRHTAAPTTASAFAKATACLPSLLRISRCCFANTRPPVPALPLAPGLPWQLLSALAPFPPLPAACMRAVANAVIRSVLLLLFSPQRGLSSFFDFGRKTQIKIKMKTKPEQNFLPRGSRSPLNALLLLIWELRIQRISGSQIFHNPLSGLSTILGKLKEGEYREERFRETAFIIT